MVSALTPYGRGREWMRGKGPHAGKSCADAIDACGYDWDSVEERQFIAGADSVCSDGLNEDER